MAFPGRLLDGSRVVLAWSDSSDVGFEVGGERPRSFLAGSGHLVEPAELTAAGALVADERPRLALVRPVVGLQPMAFVEVTDRRIPPAGAPQVVRQLEAGSAR